jgi:hypothetical protein
MHRYPVNRQGLAVPVQEVGYEVVAHQRGLTNRHHLQFDRVNYMRSPLHRIFRGLSSRVVDMWVQDHIELHDRFTQPKMPTNIQMIDCIEETLAEQGIIECVREKKTHQMYEINLDQWESIKRGAYGLQVYGQGALRAS